MLLVGDLLAVLVLFVVRLLLLLLGKRPAICGAFIVDLLVNARLVRIGTSGFGRGFLAAAQTLCGALLLVCLTLIDFVRLHAVGIMVVVVDLLAGVILLLVDLLMLLAGELSTVGSAIRSRLAVDPRLRRSGARSLAGGHLA